MSYINEDELYDLGYEPAYHTRAREQKLERALLAEIDALRDQVLALTAIIATASPSLRRNEKSAKWRDYAGMNCWRDGKYSIVVWSDGDSILWRCYYNNRWLKEGQSDQWGSAKDCAFEAIREHGWGSKPKPKSKTTTPQALGVEP